MSKKKRSKRYKVTSASGSVNDAGKLHRNKTLALFLLISMIAFIAIYFGFLKAKMQIIQEIYIWASFVLALAYVFVAFRIAFLKQKQDGKEDGESASKLSKLDNLRRLIIILFLPMIVALFLDIMLINLGLADNLGI